MKKLILALAACAFFASCQKEEETMTIDVSKTTFLTSDKWQQKMITWLPDVDDETSTPTDVYTSLTGCVKDNYIQFQTSYIVKSFEGDTKCTTTADDSTEYGYTLTSNDNYLTIFDNPWEETHNTILAGDITYPSIDTFIVTYLAQHPTDTSKTSRYTHTYVRIK
ncbi:MAG: hypothetical protein QM642_03745 [Edaphocola sp.]